MSYVLTLYCIRTFTDKNKRKRAEVKEETLCNTFSLIAIKLENTRTFPQSNHCKKRQNDNGSLTSFCQFSLPASTLLWGHCFRVQDSVHRLVELCVFVAIALVQLHSDSSCRPNNKQHRGLPCLHRFVYFLSSSLLESSGPQF